MRPLATEAGAASMKITLQPKPNPVELSPLETILDPLEPSDLVKLSLQVGHAWRTPPRAIRSIKPVGSINLRIMGNTLIPLTTPRKTP